MREHSANPMIVTRSSPQWLQGLSWSSLSLVILFCALSALEVAVAPVREGFYIDLGDRMLAGLSRIPVFSIGGVTMLVTAVIVINAAGPNGRGRLALALFAAVLGSFVAAVTRYAVGATPASDGAAFIFKVFVAWLLPAILLTAGCVLYLRARAAAGALHATTLRQTALEKQRQEARLRLLQAQIEPHFLFNTLSNIRRLCQSDVAGGRAMLAQLTRYLRAALPKFRMDEATLDDELEIVSAYLNLQRTRMGERLRFAIDVPHELRSALVPPMMLATLVENAIKHGIGPLAEGGTIRVGAALHGGNLVLRVIDDGQGFAASSGSGVGLANVRARLKELHGAGASLALAGTDPRGVTATIALPLRRGSDAR